MPEVQVVLSGVDDVSGMVNAVAGVFSGNLVAALDLATKALSGISDTFTGFIRSALQGQDVTTAVDFAIQKQGASAAVTAGQAQQLAQSMRDLAGGQADTVLSAESVLLKFKEINSSEFPNALQLSADLASSMRTDMSSAAQALGRALENPVSGMRLIKEVGGEVDPTFQKIITSMVKTGDTADADAAIMDKLIAVVGGKAASAAGTLSGQWTVLWGNLSDIGQGIGSKFLPLLTSLFDDVVKPAADKVEALGQAFETFLGRNLTDDIGGSLQNIWTSIQIGVPALQFLGNNVIDLGNGIRNILMTAFNDLAGVVGGVIKFVQGEWPQITRTMQSVWTDLQEIFNAFGRMITNVVMPAIAEISDQTDLHLPKAQSVFDAVLTFISDGMRGWVGIIENIVIPALTHVVDWVVGNWPQIQAVASAVWGAFGDVVKIAVTYLGGALNEMQIAGSIFKDVFTGNWSDIGTQLQRLWSNNWDTIHNILSDALDLVQKAILAVDWRGMGTSIMRQFIQGVLDEAGNVVNAIFGAPYKAYQALSQQFGVQTYGNAYPSYSSAGYYYAIAGAY